MNPNQIPIEGNRGNYLIEIIKKEHPINTEVGAEEFRTAESSRKYVETANQLIAAGDALMSATHDSGEDRKEYHTSEHPKALYSRADKMADILELSPERLLLAKLAISYHDVVINVKNPPEYNPANPKSILAMATRERGAREGDFPRGKDGNEAKSAELLEQSMRSRVGRDGQTIFSEEQIDTAKFAVEATYPGVDGGLNFAGVPFKEDPYYKEIIAQNSHIGEIIDKLATPEIDISKGIKFFQPHLEEPLEKGEYVPEEVLILAMTDLGGSGVASPEEFAKEGDSEFRELYMNIGKNFKTLFEPDKTIERAEVVQAMQKWLKSQTSFVVWQMMRFEKILLLLKKNDQLNDPNKEEKLRRNFSFYETNINASLGRVTRITEETKDGGEFEAFKHIAKEMGYNV